MQENQVEIPEVVTESNVAEVTDVPDVKTPAYEITFSSKPKKDMPLSVMIDRVPELMVPGVVAISIGNKAVMYRKYLDKTLFDPNNKQRLLNFMVHLHDKGLEHKGMHLVCGCKFRFHAQVLKEFLIENMEFFSSLISYLVPGSKNKVISPDSGAAALPMLSGNTLPAEDMAQIRALIEADQGSNQEPAELVADATECPDPSLVDSNQDPSTRRIPEIPSGGYPAGQTVVISSSKTYEDSLKPLT